MSLDKTKLKSIWRYATISAFISFIFLAVVLLSIGAEIIAAIILAAVGAVVFWYVFILVAVRLKSPNLSKYVDDPKVERVGDDIEVESTTRKTGDPKLDEYVEDYAKARDFWGKTGMLILVFAILALLFFIFGNS